MKMTSAIVVVAEETDTREDLFNRASSIAKDQNCTILARDICTTTEVYLEVTPKSTLLGFLMRSIARQNKAERSA